ncbi:cytochrome c biogenesis heme-transporting ATPase CcmA [Edwardsiella anguillarum]|uniref:cytochrome c biogenesis heme-transporting ATPase CcmA n=1 Tax=Edwardsiella anguillarum TaxID=1821960 RepID=UPI000E357A4E|nr:cytochrome c biogenesis heme-transporting ATPase CcmA [Edwardsiella anguillarum]RFT03533.1 heme ABC exporter ATP-binding protein CcmA [Edwardsiella anguillarum]WHQ15046.1 cytochrome c biogenesis heme-transporting ATPase CcmA [Edwardsiella anguillarum]
MLTISRLGCRRDERVLFDDLDFRVQAGEIIQIEGPNGAGKTTLLRMMAGLALPDRGEVLWQGLPIRRQRETYQQNLLYLGHHPGVKSVMTAFENLAFYCRVLGQADEAAIWDALAQVELVGFEDVPVAQLSAGQQRRVALARLWLSQAPLWILDEPLTAIDKRGVARLIGLFERHCAAGGAIVLTTHQDLNYPAMRRLRLRGEERAV